MNVLKNIKQLSISVWIIVLCGFSTILNAQDRIVTATIDTNFITIGQQAKIMLTAQIYATDTLFWTPLADTITKDIEIVELAKMDTTFDRVNITSKILTQEVLVTAFDSGYFVIPPFNFTINDSIYKTNPLLLQVFTVQIDTSKGIADIKSPYEVPFSLWSFIKKHKYYFGGGLLLVAILVGLYFWNKNRKNSPIVVAQPKPIIPAHKIAFRRLEKLEEKQLWQKGKTKLYHIELSEIIREYLENRFGILALESTTIEIMQSLKTFNFIEPRELENLHQLLTLSDLVKFAKEHPLPAENENCLKNVKAFIHATLISKKSTSTQQSTLNSPENE